MSDLKTVVAALGEGRKNALVLRVANQLASSAEGSTRFAVHVVPTMPPALEEILFPWVCLGDEREAVLRELLDSARGLVGDELRKEWPGAPLREVLKVASGPVVDALLAEFDRLGPDVLVLGAADAQERPGLLGSVAGGVLARARAPVLVTRRAGGDTLKRVLVALDLTPASRPLLEAVLGWACAMNFAVVPFSVLPTLEALDHAGLATDRDAGARLRKQAERNMQQILGSLDLPFAVAEKAGSLLQPPVLAIGDPAEQIVRVADELSVDAICVARRRDREQGTGIGRVSEYVLRRAPRHVFVFPPGAPQAT